VRLETARCSVRLLSRVEDYGMGVKLQCGVAINGPSRIVFKSGSNKFAGGLRRVNIADPGLRVLLRFPKCCPNTLPMGFPDSLIAAHKDGERD
jgi:hypothetical protein